MKQISPHIYVVTQQKNISIKGVNLIAPNEIEALLKANDQLDDDQTMVFLHRDVPVKVLRGFDGHSSFQIAPTPVTFWEADHIFGSFDQMSLSLAARLRYRFWRSWFPGKMALYRAYTKRRFSQLNCHKESLFDNDIRMQGMRMCPENDMASIPSHSLYIPTRREENITLILRNIERQTIKAKNIVIGVHGSKTHYQRVVKAARRIENVKTLHIHPEKTVGYVLNRLIEACEGDLVIKMDDDDLYGPLYVRDMILTHVSTQAPMFGKAPEAVYFEKSDTTYVRDAGRRSRNVIATPADICSGQARVSGATLGGLKSHFLAFPYDELAERSVDSATFLKYQSEGFNIAIDDGSQVLTLRESDKTGHRWKISDDDLKRQALFFCQGQSALWSGIKRHVGAE